MESPGTIDGLQTFRTSSLGFTRQGNVLTLSRTAIPMALTTHQGFPTTLPKINMG